MEDKKENFLGFSTLEECQAIFEEHIEPNVDQYAESERDRLSILRICVELLSRLEDTPNYGFAGRVLIFLAKVLTFFDQSGLNLRSEFSVKEFPNNVTDHLKRIVAKNAEKDEHLAKLINHEIEEGETISDDDSNDYVPQEDADRIYERFWKVQQFLNQPNILYDKNSWLTFRMHVDTFIISMENKPPTTSAWDLKSSFLTEPKTFVLQLNDVYMRRTFLLQILIVLQYLDLPVEIRPETFTLDKLQLSWISTTTKRIYGLIDGMPNQEEGRKFLGYVRHILKREEMWNRWKNGKCKEPKRPEAPDDDDELINMRGTYHKKRNISDELSNAKPYNMHVIGSPEMSRLWNMKQRQKFNTPDLRKYLDIPPEKQTELFKDPNYSFRTLRLLRKSPHFFIPTSAAIQSLDGYLREATKNITVPSQT